MTEETKTEETAELPVVEVTKPVEPGKTRFDERIDAVVDGVGDAVKDVAEGINHLTDDIADAVGHVFHGVKEAVGGEPATHDEDLDPTNKMGK